MLMFLRKLQVIFGEKGFSKGLLVLGFTITSTLLEVGWISMVFPFLQLLANPDAALENVWLRWAYDFSNAGNVERFLVYVGVTLIVFILFKSLFVVFSTYVSQRIIQTAHARISSFLFGIYLNMSWDFHIKRNSAIIVRNTLKAVDDMFRELVLPLLLSITDGLLVVAICGVLIAVEPMATIIVAGILMLTTVPFYRLFRKKAGSWGGLVQESEARKIRWLNEGLGSLKEVKVCGRESFFQDSFSRETNATARLQALYHTICAVPRNSMEIIIVSGMVLVILFYQVKGGVLTNAIPTLGLFTMAAFRVLPSVSRLGHSFITIRYGAAAMNHIYEDIVLYRTRLKPNAKGEEQVNLLFERQIVLEGVSFQYPGSATRTFSNINLSIKQGESVALIGPSGSGKTTLVDLILGILSPSDGCILVDERNIALNLRSWQSKVGYVPQTLYLCDDSLRRNIAFAIPEEEIDNRRVGEVIELACLKDLVESLPEGVETRVGERGVCLSGGQRQRIGIARALYGRPELLVLDEATSALDSNSEHQITMALERLKGTITIIVIAHRLTTVQWCDRLVFIKDGCIVDTGPYDELFTGSQDFRHFVQLQEFKGQV